MSMSDPIADLLTRIRNAHMRNLPTVAVPSSKLKKAIVALLQEEGYIEGFSEDVKGAHATLNIQLKYYNGKPVLEYLQRVSRPGLRIYKSANDLFAVKNGLGEAIVSTSRGVMTARKAKAAGVGGELLCIVS